MVRRWYGHRASVVPLDRLVGRLAGITLIIHGHTFRIDDLHRTSSCDGLAEPTVEHRRTDYLCRIVCATAQRHAKYKTNKSSVCLSHSASSFVTGSIGSVLRSYVSPPGCVVLSVLPLR